jgi:hypothetical protein
MNDPKLLKLINQIKKSFKNEADPQSICRDSRYSCEAILSWVWKLELGEYPSNKTIKPLFDDITKHNPKLIPKGIEKHIGTIQSYGNFSSHPQEDLEELDITHVFIIQSSLTQVCNWFFLDYLEMKPAPDITPSFNLKNAQTKNYKELILNVLADGVLDLEEYEQVIDARESLGIDGEECEKIESEALREKFNNKITSLLEILKPTDLAIYKEKYNTINYPDWFVYFLDNILNNDSVGDLEKSLFSFYFKEIKTENMHEIPAYINLLGCWQGWYFQDEMKTFYTISFVLKGENDFYGISFEPKNPAWNSVIESQSDLLIAEIRGEIENDVIILFNKKYQIERPWEINYQGVLTEEGQFIEGEWEINKLNGSFNALKSKSLLPIHIFDTNRNIPITRIKYLDKLKNLTSTWFIQLTGKVKQYGLLHIIEFKEEIICNLVFESDNRIELFILKGSFDGSGNVSLNETSSLKESMQNFHIRFTVDWSLNQINGTVKDNKFKLRSLRGFKI